MIVAVVISLVLVSSILVVAAINSRRKKPNFISSFSGKHVFITGASSGIGLSLSKQFLSEGAFVTLVARNSGRLEDAAKFLLKEVQCSSDQFRTKVADVGDYAVIRRVIEEAFAWRPIDVLICNAGLLRTAYFEDLKLQDINDLMQTNVMGSVYPVHAALPSLKQRSRTHPICIVFVASLASLVKKQKSDHNTCLVTRTNFKTRHSRERYERNSAAVLVHMPISHTCL
jgi:3-dehydrosphinganine reductase